MGADGLVQGTLPWSDVGAQNVRPISRILIGKWNTSNWYSSAVFVLTERRYLEE